MLAWRWTCRQAQRHLLTDTLHLVHTQCHHGDRDDYIKKTRLRGLIRAGAHSYTHKNALGVSAVGWPALGCSCCPRPVGRGRSHLRYDAGKLRVSGPVLRRLRSWSCHSRGIDFLAAVCSRSRQSQTSGSRRFCILKKMRALPHKTRPPTAPARAVTETPRLRATVCGEDVTESQSEYWSRRREERPLRQHIDNPTRRVIAKSRAQVSWLSEVWRDARLISRAKFGEERRTRG